MSPNWLAGVVVLSTVTACGLDLGEEFTVAEDPPAADASASNDLSVDAALGRDSTTADVAAIAPAVESGPPEDGGAMKIEAPRELDATAIEAPPGVGPEASVEPPTPCERLAKCCLGQAAVLPAVQFGCMLGAAQADGGDAGTCAAILDSFTKAALCSFGSSDARLEE